MVSATVGVEPPSAAWSAAASAAMLVARVKEALIARCRGAMSLVQNRIGHQSAELEPTTPHAAEVETT